MWKDPEISVNPTQMALSREKKKNKKTTRRFGQAPKLLGLLEKYFFCVVLVAAVTFCWSSVYVGVNWNSSLFHVNALEW